MTHQAIRAALGLIALGTSLQPAAAQTAEPYQTPIAMQAAPAPPVTRALLPGHWQLEGARYVWVPPEKTLRAVDERPLVPAQNVWYDGSWVYVPSHRAAGGE